MGLSYSQPKSTATGTTKRAICVEDGKIQVHGPVVQPAEEHGHGHDEEGDLRRGWKNSGPWACRTASRRARPRARRRGRSASRMEKFRSMGLSYSQPKSTATGTTKRAICVE